MGVPPPPHHRWPHSGEAVVTELPEMGPGPGLPSTHSPAAVPGAEAHRLHPDGHPPGHGPLPQGGHLPAPWLSL